MTAPRPRESEPLLISLAGVAQLAGVQRPVASMWRSRFRDAEVPFPPAVARRGGRDLFDAEAVGAWLVETAHGNNPEAVGDAAAAADGVAVDFSDPDDVAELAALIVLRAQAGLDLASQTPGDLRALAAHHDPRDELLRREIDRHADRDAPWAGYADRLVDASFSAEAALARVHERARRAQRAHGSAGAVSPAVRDLLVALVTGLAQSAHTDRPTVRVHPGVDTEVFDAVDRAFDGEVDLVWPGGGDVRALRRAGASRGIPLDVPPAAAECVALARVPPAAGATSADTLAAVDEFALSLRAGDSGVVAGPARVLVDGLRGAVAAARADVLRTGRVRAVVRLDAGLVTSASREALALWVLGPQADIALGDRVIALADLTGVALTPAAVDDLTADILANIGGPAQARAHAFRFARLARTSSVLARSGALVTDTSVRRPRSGASRDLPALVDAALAAAGGDAPALDVNVEAAALSEPRTVALGDAVAAGNARVVSGTRLTADESADAGLVVVTADDLDDPARIGARHVGQLAFAQAHPAAQLTRPGDVVFRTSPTARAWVDHDGSHVVAYPARVLRVTAGDPGGLVPELVADDIARSAPGPGAWRRWRVRVVDPAQRQPLRDALAVASITRNALHERIARLDELTRVLADAVAARAVTLDDRPTR